MSFIAIVEVTVEGRVGIYAEFERRQDADAHVELFGGFVVPRNGASLAHMKIGTGNAITLEEPAAPVVVESKERRAIRLLADAATPAVRAQILALFAP